MSKYVNIKKVMVNAGQAIIRLSDRFAKGPVYDSSSPVAYAQGATQVMDLLISRPEIINCVIVRKDREPEIYHNEAIERAYRTGKRVIYVDYEYPQGISRRYSIMAECYKYDDRIEPGSHVVLVEPVSRGNVGFIIRSALAFDIHDIAIISKKPFDTFSPNILRSSMGTRFSTHLEVFGTIEDYIERFPENKRYAFMLDDRASKLNEIKKEEPYSLIFGNESCGLPPEFAEFCQPVYIEQNRELDSLNLATSASIALYSFARQKA